MRPGALLQRLESLYLVHRATRNTPLIALADLVRSGRSDPERTLALCIKLGLPDRARRTLRESGMAPTPALALQLAWLEGDFATLDRLAADSATSASLRRTPQNTQNRCLSIVAQRSPQAALALVTSMPRRPLCAPAVAWRAGEPAIAEAWRRNLRWRLHADYLLLDANRASNAQHKLAAFNDYLSHHGLAPLRLIDAALPLSVCNVVAAESSAGGGIGPVSVVIPAHDNERHIGASIESMLRQTCPPAEIVVVDDASRDGTSRVVGELAAAHPAIRLIRLPANRGAYFARNVGLAAAHGEFVAFQDADDFAHPQRLALSVEPLLRDAEVHASTSRCVRLSDDGMFGEVRLWPLTRWTPISLVVRREIALTRVGFFEEVRFGADSEYVARLRLLLGERHHRLVAQPLALFGQRAGSLTTAADTGFDSKGRSGPRIAYQETWTERHLASLLGSQALYRPASSEVAELLGARSAMGDGRLCGDGPQD
ncbi:glycosyltransferase family A protein [Methylibium sp.]|uniref:glycosyltransferase family 2 protein n=1 Tax=Methylibium sp. TaxID=2067992 RepID=UPI0017E30091|nr:glycosyltransferase family A protein [Methylibium sp.]MBA3588101.1 glycosyltransferase family 2 protein [Methylibium sp.]